MREARKVDWNERKSMEWGLRRAGKKVGREKEAERVRPIVRGEYNVNESKQRGRQGVEREGEKEGKSLRRKGRLGSRDSNEYKGIVLPCAVQRRRIVVPFCAGRGLCSGPSSTYPLCFTFSTVIHARVTEKGTLNREGHPISLYLTALEMALEFRFNICFATFYCSSH